MIEEHLNRDLAIELALETLRKISKRASIRWNHEGRRAYDSLIWIRDEAELTRERIERMKRQHGLGDDNA